MVWYGIGTKQLFGTIDYHSRKKEYRFKFPIFTVNLLSILLKAL